MPNPYDDTSGMCWDESNDEPEWYGESIPEMFYTDIYSSNTYGFVCDPKFYETLEWIASLKETETNGNK